MTYRVAIYDVENGDRGYVVRVPQDKPGASLFGETHPYTVDLYTGSAVYPIAHFPTKGRAVTVALALVDLLEERFPDRLGYDFRLEPVS